MFAIREGRKEDCVAIEAMIREWAEYENLPNGPEIDHKILERDGFGEQRLFRTLVAQTADKEVVGFALYYDKYSTWVGKSLWMEELYVRSEFRRRGIGKALIAGLAKKGAQKGYNRLELNCYLWNLIGIDFIKGFGAQDATAAHGLEQLHTFRFNKEQMKEIGAKSNLP